MIKVYCVMCETINGQTKDILKEKKAEEGRDEERGKRKEEGKPAGMEDRGKAVTGYRLLCPSHILHAL